VHGIFYPARHNHTRAAVALFDREGLPRIEVNRTVSWHSPEGDMRSTLAALLDLYGFNIPGQPANRASSICSTSNGAGRRDDPAASPRSQAKSQQMTAESSQLSALPLN